MTARVIRFYDSNNDDPEDLNEFWMSVVADETSAMYVFPENGAVRGVDDERIESLVRAYMDGVNPTTPEQWAAIAATAIHGMTYDGPEYETIGEAKEAELVLLNRAKELRDILAKDEDYA